MASDHNKHEKLTRLRKKIDQADKELLKALSGRMKTVLEIANYKRQHELPIVQKGRWKQLMRDRKDLAERLNLHDQFTKDLFALIHREALRLQRKRK